ncbi:MAG: L-serine ammonia-lyase, iron-sulfur-dependent subunit beta [Bacteroidota bacterium]
MPRRSSIFDMIGPVMIGPSSSHTGGVARIGRVAHHLLGGQPEQVTITFYNSFARTYEGHGSDRAILGGLLDFKPDDERIKTAYDHAKEADLQFKMKAVSNASALHPNSILLDMVRGDKKLKVLGESRGGGVISIVSVDGFDCDFSAANTTVIVTAEDVEGSIAFITNVISQGKVNIATMSVKRSGKRGIAKLVMELDHTLKPITLEYLRSLDWVQDVVYLVDLDI